MRSQRVPPLFGFYYPLTLIVSLFALHLDMIYRSCSMSRQLPLPLFLKNALFMVLFCAIVSLPLSLLLQAVERGAALLGRRDGSAGLSTFLLYLLLVYANLLYLKFFIMARSTLDPSSPPLWLGWILFGLLALFAALFPLLRRGGLGHESLAGAAAALARPLLVGAGGCAALCAGMFLADSVFREAVPARGKEAKPNIIFVTFDSLTSLHMSAYGYGRSTTPCIDRFARESYVFERMRTNSNSTEEGLTSFLGVYPRMPGERYVHSLLETLRDAGWRSRYFLTTDYFPERFYAGVSGFTTIRCFEDTRLARLLFRGRNRESFWWLSNLLSENHRFFNLFYLIDPRNADVKYGDPFPLHLYFEHALDRLVHEPRPAFLWAHLYEPHFPYLVPPSFTDYLGDVAGTYGGMIPLVERPRGSPEEWERLKARRIRFLIDRYDTCIRYTDGQFGVFLEKLKAAGLYDSSIIVVSADHGQSFGEPMDGRPGEFLFGQMGTSLNESVCRIPLIIHAPGQSRGVRVQTSAEQVDLAPTLLDMLDVPVPSWMEGESLVRYMEHEKEMSGRLKMTVPAPFFYRDYGEFRRRGGAFVDTYHLYWGRYKIGFQVDYASPPAGSGAPLTSRFVFVYDVLGDPGQKRNLLLRPEMDALLRKVFESPLLDYYRRQYAP